MSVQIIANRNGAVFFCSTTDWAFGPVMPNEDVAEAFLRTFQRPDDPRNYDDAQLSKSWSRFRERLSCPFGHFEKADVINHSNGQTIFSCMERGCKAVWDLEGNVIDEDEEDDAD